MASNPYLLMLPSADAMPARTLRDNVSAIAINAESTADARAFVKARYGNDVNKMWDDADISQVVAGSDLSGWKMRVRVVSAAGVVTADETVEASGVTAGVAASGVLTSTQNYANGETVTIGTTVYTFKTALTPADGEVLVGASEAASLANLHHAINGTGGTAGTDYQVAAAHADVTATDDGSHVVTVTAKVKGTAANAIVTTETSAHASWGAATLTGGIDAALSGLAGLMVTALNALSAIAGAAFNNSTHTLTVADTSDALGDHRLFVYVIPADADPDNLIGIPGMVGAITDQGSSADALTVVLAADSYAIPKVASLMGAAA